MAIFTGGTAAAVPQVANNTNFHVGAQGQGVVNGANNNFNSKSPGFQTIDALIRSLDAQYDLLADKTPWVTYAATINGEWQLCANCQPESSGKKLFRQYNFNRQSIGLSVATVPVDGTEFCHSGGTGWRLYSTLPLGQFFSTTDYVQVPGAWCMMQVGSTWTNPVLFLTPTPISNVYAHGTPVFDFLITQTIGTTIDACVFTPNGAPGLRMGWTRYS
jgi:hypothetical protein